MAQLLDDIIEKLRQTPQGELSGIRDDVQNKTSGHRWVPNPGPQTEAYYCKADVLLYGGEPGGGKSQLCLGLAFTKHRRTRLMRRNYGDLERLIDDALTINGGKTGFNGSPPPKLRISENQLLHFGAANRVGDEQQYMGQGIDLLAVDEATHFAESQIRFMMGWVRTEIPNQRTRTVLATNPPLRPEGLWVVKMFAPWLDPTFDNPAVHGELRWVISDEDGNDLWVNGPDDIRVINGKEMRPTSRTYIPSSVSDNPFYAGTDYERQLDAMPEPYRSLLMGGFRTSFEDVPNQMIPTAHVLLAQDRWKNPRDKSLPMCSIGVDASGGGKDPMVLARRWDGWFDELIVTEGKDIPMERAGSFCAGQVVSYRRDDATVIVDLGGGYGSSMYEQLHANGIAVKGFKGAEKTTRKSQRDGKLQFVNTRTAAYWLFREALDPDQPGGSPISLPPDQELVADLTAATFDVTPSGIKMEPKEKVIERIGRSTNKGDAVVMAWFYGPRKTSHALEWLTRAEPPKVITSRQPLSARRRAG